MEKLQHSSIPIIWMAMDGNETQQLVNRSKWTISELYKPQCIIQNKNSTMNGQNYFGRILKWSKVPYCSHLHKINNFTHFSLPLVQGWRLWVFESNIHLLTINWWLTTSVFSVFFTFTNLAINFGCFYLWIKANGLLLVRDILNGHKLVYKLINPPIVTSVASQHNMQVLSVCVHQRFKDIYFANIH